MKASELKEMSVSELNENLAGLKEELFALRFSCLHIAGVFQYHYEHQRDKRREQDHKIREHGAVSGQYLPKRAARRLRGRQGKVKYRHKRFLCRLFYESSISYAPGFVNTRASYI